MEDTRLDGYSYIGAWRATLRIWHGSAYGGTGGNGIGLVDGADRFVAGRLWAEAGGIGAGADSRVWRGRRR
jgi:hypothetical protein